LINLIKQYSTSISFLPYPSSKSPMNKSPLPIQHLMLSSFSHLTITSLFTLGGCSEATIAFMQLIPKNKLYGSIYLPFIFIGLIFKKIKERIHSTIKRHKHKTCTWKSPPTQCSNQKQLEQYRKQPQPSKLLLIYIYFKFSLLFILIKFKKVPLPFDKKKCYFCQKKCYLSI
jgi:hypothetical protein